MYNSLFYIGAIILTLPFQSHGISCWCQKGPSTYQELVDSEHSSSYTNCYLTGNNPSSDTCFDATCPGGDWVKGNSYAFGEQLISATDGDDCISQCLALGGDFNIANMLSTCDNDDTTANTCNVFTCPQVWDGQCGAFKKETDKWCDYDYDDHYDGRVCCAADFNDCCQDDQGAIGGTIAGAVVFIIFCVWYCRRRRDNTNEEPPNCAYKIFCPPCAVFGYQGCESKSDACMTCCCCWFFTLCCWEPKQVIVDNNPIGTEIQMDHIVRTSTEKYDENI
jgi:hypothetical protein